MLHDASKVATILFTDIESSNRLWEQEPERMHPALARHDALARAAVDGNHGAVVKMTGDGLYAAFEDSLDAVVVGAGVCRACQGCRAVVNVDTGPLRGEPFIGRIVARGLF